MYIIKYRPEDFLVEEKMDLDGLDVVQGQTEGTRFLILQLTKVNWNTVDAVRTIARRLHVPVQRIGYGGLKDKNAKTMQYISIEGKTWEEVNFLKIKDMELTFVGYSAQAIGLGQLTGNSFDIVVRNLEAPLHSIDFVTNYYDDQRFGGIRPNTHVIGKLLLTERYEEAARVLLCESYPREREEHRRMREKVSWPKVVPEEFPKHLRTERAIVEYLSKNPGQYKDAFAKVPRRILTLYVQAYQSYLFNKILAAHIVERSNEVVIIEEDFPVGPCEAAQLPLIGYDYEVEPGIIQEVLQFERISPVIFGKKSSLGLASSTILRDTVIPISMEVADALPDPFFPDTFCQRVRFSLPKGAYASMVIKQMA